MCVAVWLCGCVIGWWSAESGGSRCGESVHTCEFCSAGEGEKERGREGGGRWGGGVGELLRPEPERCSACRGERTPHWSLSGCALPHTEGSCLHTQKERETNRDHGSKR